MQRNIEIKVSTSTAFLTSNVLMNVLHFSFQVPTECCG